VGDVLFVAGGQDTPDATQALKSVYALDLADTTPRWKELPPWPGPARMLAVAASCDGAFWLIGGVDLVEVNGQPTRRYLRDAYRFDPGKGWTRVADLPHPLVASPSPAASDPAGFSVFGGDDGSKVGFQPLEAHPGFNPSILRYTVQTNTWTPVGALPAARVTTPLVRWQARWIIPSGEARPGVRSPQVWSCLEPDSE
jgi:N-acetylneuraminate epimerase